MNTKIISLCIVIFLFLFFDNSSADAEGGKIIISEIQITGDKGHSDDDFIELYNPNLTSINISNYRLRYRNSAGTEGSINEIGKNICIPAHGYYLWANSDGAFAAIADTTTKTGLSSKYSLSLLLPSGVAEPLIDSVSWENNHAFNVSAYRFATSPTANKSMVRDIATGDWLSDFSLVPTPTKSTNTLCPQAESIQKSTYNTTVRLNELLANPSGKEEETEFVELYNPSDTLFDLSSWSLRDASASGKYVFPDKMAIQPKSFLIIYRSTFSFALNNSNETVTLLDPNGEARDTVSYKTAKKDTSYNYTSTGWRGGVPTPGTPNQANTLPETRERVPKKGYRGVALDFDAQGKDSDRDTLKYTWDFGDNHKSYKKKTTHTYEENGTYAVILKTSDGKDDVEETFTLKIESYPRREIRIISLLPNPAGKDSGKEWLLIENREKKTVNLKGYSVATGWKTMSNHPIREDFFIKSKKQATLTRDSALFTLPNQKGKIELRAPDGKVLQNIKYKLDKPVVDNMVYRKEKGSGWKWDMSFIQKVAPSPKEETLTTIEEAGTLIPKAPENTSEEIVPSAEKDIPTETRESSQIIETRSDRISLDPDRLIPQDILAYGTRVQMPDSITLTVSSDKKANPTPLPEIFPLSGEESLLTKINASLNDFLNSAE